MTKFKDPYFPDDSVEVFDNKGSVYIEWRASPGVTGLTLLDDDALAFAREIIDVVSKRKGDAPA